MLSPSFEPLQDILVLITHALLHFLSIHKQLSSGIIDLNYDQDVYLCSFFMCASSESIDETVLLHGLVCVFVARI